MLRSLEASLERLGVDRVDVALLHDPDDHADQALREAYPALDRLRAEGVIGAIGVGTNQSALPARFLRETDIDVVLLAGRYTLLEQDSLTDLLPEAAARGRSVVIGGVFNSGLLTAPGPAPHTTTHPLRSRSSTGRCGSSRSANATACRCVPPRCASRSAIPRS